MNIVYGNLLDLAENGEFDIIIHGCNCICTMGAGLARQIAKRYPEVYQEDLASRPNQRKLGGFTVRKVNGFDFRVINAYTQPLPGPTLSLEALTECFESIVRIFGGCNHRFAYPKIGCGLGGGNWDEVGSIIDGILDGENHTLVVWEK